MSSKLRLALPMAFIGVLGAACFLLLQSHASARVHMNYSHLNKIQRRLVSETLASALGSQSTGLRPHVTGPIGDDDNGGGPDGAPFTPPKSFGSPGGAGPTINYFPSSGSCSANLGNNVKVNQNCLNLTDANLQGRGQANNEPSISVDPFNSKDLVASDNNYIRGDGTCGAYYSHNGGRSGSNTTVPTVSPAAYVLAREYWQAGGDTSVAWDTRGQRLHQLPAVQPRHSSVRESRRVEHVRRVPGDPERRCLLELPRALLGDVHFDPTGTPACSGQGADGGRRQRQSPYRDRIYVTWTDSLPTGRPTSRRSTPTTTGRHSATRWS